MNNVFLCFDKTCIKRLMPLDFLGSFISNFNVSLNGSDALPNSNSLLSELGIVSGDLIFVVPTGDAEGNSLAEPSGSGARPQPLSTWSSSDLTSTSTSNDSSRNTCGDESSEESYSAAQVI